MRGSEFEASPSGITDERTLSTAAVAKVEIITILYSLAVIRKNGPIDRLAQGYESLILFVSKKLNNDRMMGG